MNKKIMVIELLEMFFKKEKMPKRIKVGAFEFEYREELNAYFNINEKSSCEDLLENWFEDARQLNQEVEILEDNTEEIEEKSNFEDMGYEIAQAYFEFYKGIAKALTEKRKESEDK